MAKNKCQWLIIASLDRCNRKCYGQYCWIHNARLKKSPGTTPCIKCGRGCRNKYSLCSKCGYHSAYTKMWNRNDRAIRKEHDAQATVMCDDA